jgi:hypothetical protein
VLGLQDACADGRSICFGVVVCGYPFGCRILYHVHYVENKVKTAMKLETESAANFLIHLMQIKRGKVFLPKKLEKLQKAIVTRLQLRYRHKTLTHPHNNNGQQQQQNQNQKQQQQKYNQPKQQTPSRESGGSGSDKKRNHYVSSSSTALSTASSSSSSKARTTPPAQQRSNPGYYTHERYKDQPDPKRSRQ